MPDTNLSALLWSVADLLRGDYKQSEYGKVILPFTVLRRLDCVLAPTKQAVLKEHAKRSAAGLEPDQFCKRVAGGEFYNVSPLDLKKLLGDQDHIEENLRAYVQGFSPAVRDIFEQFEFHTQIDRLAKAKLLYLVTEKFAGVDLHPEMVSNADMGLVFEELIRRFAELSNETAGEHFTPREVIRLMVNLILTEDDDVLRKPGVVRQLYDPTAGTGGMLSVAEEYLQELNPQAWLVMHGQELNPECYAICKADLLIKGQDIGNIVLGNTLSEAGHRGQRFDYMLSNPPFGVEWKKVEKEVRRELSDAQVADITQLLGNDDEVTWARESIGRIFKNKKSRDRAIVEELPNERWATELCHAVTSQERWQNVALVLGRHTVELWGWQHTNSSKTTSAAASAHFLRSHSEPVPDSRTSIQQLRSCDKRPLQLLGLQAAANASALAA